MLPIFRIVRPVASNEMPVKQAEIVCNPVTDAFFRLAEIAELRDEITFCKCAKKFGEATSARDAGFIQYFFTGVSYPFPRKQIHHFLRLIRVLENRSEQTVIFKRKFPLIGE